MNRFAKLYETAQHQVLLQVVPTEQARCVCGSPECDGVADVLSIFVTSWGAEVVMSVELYRGTGQDLSPTSKAFALLAAITQQDATAVLRLMQDGWCGVTDKPEMAEQGGALVRGILARLTAQA